jgi:hypothetical protein
MARGPGNVARAARVLSWFGRDAQPRSGFCFGEDLMLRRHDYNVNVAGGFGAAQLTSDYMEADGLRLPTRCRAYARGPDRRPISEMLLVSIDISEIEYLRLAQSVTARNALGVNEKENAREIATMIGVVS